MSRCQDEGMLVDEALYPALNEESDLVLMSKKHRCMQPKDTPVRTPENDRRMKSKLDKLMEAITLKQTIVVDDSAIFIDEDSGIIYSPTFKRADYMAERLKQMKEKHENISPTASQMSSSVAVKPSPENSQTVFRFICENSDENSSASVAELDHSPHEKKDCEESGAIEQDDIDKPFSKDLEKPWLSPCRSDISKRLSISPLKFPDLTINEEEGKKKQRMASVKKSQRKNSKSVGLAQSLVKEVASADSKDASKRKRRVRMDSYSSFDTMQVQPIHRFDQERPNFHWAEEKNNKIDMLGNRLCHDQSKLQSKRTRGRHSFSALARSFGSSSESCNAASSSPDAEDDVFDDFFSSVNHKKLKRSFLPLLPDLTDLDISSELDYVPKKKQRKCESAATETNGSKTSKVNKVGRRSESMLSTKVLDETQGKPNKRPCSALQKINKAKVRTLVMTSMPTEKQNTVVQVVKALGGFSIADQVCESTTHVVSGEHKRTLNILLGIARGCWIISFEWIMWCLEQRQWIPEEPYELSEQFPAAQICRLQRHLSSGDYHQQDLFQDQPPIFVSQHSQPPASSLVELIQLCGGTVCKTVRQAGIFIGRYSGRRPVGSRILSEQWVLDSITHLKQLDYDHYDLA